MGRFFNNHPERPRSGCGRDMIGEITPLLITCNEMPNIGRVLDRLSWAKQIVVIDSGSTDGTLEVLQEDSRVRVIHREFDSFATQCNFGLDQVESEWVLSLDADYVLTDELVEELRGLDERDEVQGYEAAFRYCIYGTRLRASLYPPRTVLYRRRSARYGDEGHGHRVRIEGTVEKLRGRILHDDRKPLSRWIDSQKRYAEVEARHLLAADSSKLLLQDRLRRWIWPSVPLVFLYTLVWKRCLFDGWPGWFYSLQRVYAEVLLSLRLLDLKLKRQ